jgi:hypothetical protein
MSTGEGGPMSRVVMFGVDRIAERAHFYLTHDSPADLVDFTVDHETLPTVSSGTCR